MKKITKAVIPAAGFGTRFMPFTKALPKEMLPIVDTPTIEYIVREAMESGIKDILIIINSEKENIKAHFGKNERLDNFLISKGKEDLIEKLNEIHNTVNITYTYQHQQLGLGHAVLCAKEFADGEPFALLLGDDVFVGNKMPAIKQLMNNFEKLNSSILGTIIVPDCDVSKYGICDPYDDINKFDIYDPIRLKGIIEKPSLSLAPTRIATCGRYILTPKIFELLETQQKGYGGEIQLTDSILRLMAYENVYSQALDAKRYDLGSKKGFLEATVDFALANDELHDYMVEIINSRKK